MRLLVCGSDAKPGRERRRQIIDLRFARDKVDPAQSSNLRKELLSAADVHEQEVVWQQISGLSLGHKHPQHGQFPDLISDLEAKGLAWGQTQVCCQDPTDDDARWLREETLKARLEGSLVAQEATKRGLGQGIDPQDPQRPLIEIQGHPGALHERRDCPDFARDTQLAVEILRNTAGASQNLMGGPANHGLGAQ